MRAIVVIHGARTSSTSVGPSDAPPPSTDGLPARRRDATKPRLREVAAGVRYDTALRLLRSDRARGTHQRALVTDRGWQPVLTVPSPVTTMSPPGAAPRQRFRSTRFHRCR